MDKTRAKKPTGIETRIVNKSHEGRVETATFFSIAKYQRGGIEVADNSKFQLTSSLTIEAWINVAGQPSNGQGPILFRGDNRPGLDPYVLEDFGNGSSVKFEVENETGGVAAVTAALPGLHQWVFVAGELNGSNGALTLYINGKLAASTVTTIRPFGTLIAGDQPGLGIGGLEANFGPANNVDFNGSIDELRLSNTALPPSQFLDAPGTVFGDSNANGKKDSTELGLGLWTVYLDINNNGKLDTGDKSVTTDINGNFTFTSLAAGTYYLRLVPVTGDTATTPALIKVVLTAGEISTGNLFGQD